MINRRVQNATSLGLCLLTLISGCAPTQPFYFQEDGDLSHYMDVATQIEYPDVSEQPLDEVQAARAPLTLLNADNFQIWDVTLEEVTRYTLMNSNVMRQLGGRINDGGQNISTTTPETLTGQPGAAGGAVTTYDVALAESGYGGNTGSRLSQTGVEAALSEFDAQVDSSMIWQNNDRPQNFGLITAPNFFNPRFRQDTGRYTLGVTKPTADGSTFEFRNNVNYDQNNNGSRTQPSDWFVNFEAAITRPLLQGAGTQYNRIAGPRSFQEYSGGFADQIDGVIISRIRTDLTLTEFETGVRNLMRDVEDAYWELYFTYRDLEARKIGRAAALETWRKVKAKERVGGEGGEADKEAQARSQFFLFQGQVETAFTNLLRVENRLRYIMGLSVSDGRLIRPSDEPTTAQVHFDWATVHAESLTRREELRRQKWEVKKRELELIAARNQLLPRLDAVGRYRWLGAGDELIDANGTGVQPFFPNSNAVESLVAGDFQEWEMGLQLNMPLGFRRAMSQVRHHQLLLTRERAVLQDMELEVSHQLGDAIRDLDLNYQLAQSNFNRRAAAEDEVRAVAAILEAGRVTLDLLLDAQRRRAEAESAFYRSLADFNRAIMRVHYRKGSLLEYNGVYLAEGPWPGKAYFDALRRARQRDASLYVDYGYTRPRVISRGPNAQMSGTSDGSVYQGPVEGAPARDGGSPTPGEEIPRPVEPMTNESASNLGSAGMVVPASAAQPVMSDPNQGSAPANPFSKDVIYKAGDITVRQGLAPAGESVSGDRAATFESSLPQPQAGYETEAHNSPAAAASIPPGGGSR